MNTNIVCPKIVAAQLLKENLTMDAVDFLIEKKKLDDLQGLVNYSTTKPCYYYLKEMGRFKTAFKVLEGYFEGSPAIEDLNFLIMEIPSVLSMVEDLEISEETKIAMAPIESIISGSKKPRESVKIFLSPLNITINTSARPQNIEATDNFLFYHLMKDLELLRALNSTLKKILAFDLDEHHLRTYLAQAFYSFTHFFPRLLSFFKEGFLFLKAPRTHRPREIIERVTFEPSEDLLGNNSKIRTGHKDALADLLDMTKIKSEKEMFAFVSETLDLGAPWDISRRYELEEGNSFNTPTFVKTDVELDKNILFNVSCRQAVEFIGHSILNAFVHVNFQKDGWLTPSLSTFFEKSQSSIEGEGNRAASDTEALWTDVSDLVSRMHEHEALFKINALAHIAQSDREASSYLLELSDSKSQVVALSALKAASLLGADPETVVTLFMNLVSNFQNRAQEEGQSDAYQRFLAEIAVDTVGNLRLDLSSLLSLLDLFRDEGFFDYPELLAYGIAKAVFSNSDIYDYIAKWGRDDARKVSQMYMARDPSPYTEGPDQMYMARDPSPCTEGPETRGPRNIKCLDIYSTDTESSASTSTSTLTTTNAEREGMRSILNEENYKEKRAQLSSLLDRYEGLIGHKKTNQSVVPEAPYSSLALKVASLFISPWPVRSLIYANNQTSSLLCFLRQLEEESAVNAVEKIIAFVFSSPRKESKASSGDIGEVRKRSSFESQSNVVGKRNSRGGEPASSQPEEGEGGKERKGSKREKGEESMFSEQNSRYWPQGPEEKNLALIYIPWVLLKRSGRIEKFEKDMLNRLVDLIGNEICNYPSSLCAVLGILNMGDPRPEFVNFMGNVVNAEDDGISNNIKVIAVFSLGVLGFGTGNQRIADILKHSVANEQYGGSVYIASKICLGFLDCGKGVFSLKQDARTVKVLCSMFAQLVSVTDRALNVRFLLEVLDLLQETRPKWIVGVDEQGDFLKDLQIRIGREVGDVSKKEICGGLVLKTPFLKSCLEEAEVVDERFIRRKGAQRTCYENVPGHVVSVYKEV